MIDVCLLGTGGMMPLPSRWLSSLLIRHEGRLTLVDCGEGTQIALRALGWGLRAIDTVCISHYHADHVSGLVGILLTLANAERVEPVHLFGPPGLRDVVRGQRVIAPALPFHLVCHELAPGDNFPAGKLKGRCSAGFHGVPVLAYRFDLPRRPRFRPERARALGVPVERWKDLQRGESVEVGGGVIEASEVLGTNRRGLSVAYVTDSRPIPTLREFVAGADLLVCEAMFGDSAEAPRAATTGHMTFAEAAEFARQAGVATLWLTHFSPALDAPLAFRSFAEDIFPNVIIGFDGLTTTLMFEED